MKIVNIKITDSAKQELRNAKIEGNKLIFPNKISNYSELKKIFSQIGVTWNKKDKMHYLSPDSKDQINYILGGGQIVDTKKTRQLFETPQELAAQVVELAEIKGTDSCLEPSAGKGALVKEMLVKTYDVDIVEIDTTDFNYCIKNFNCTGWNMDFLEFDKDKSYDKITMNPPFTRGLWVKHISHAWNFLKKGGKLVAICPNAEHNTQFQKFIEDKDYKTTELEAGLFKSEGTAIAVMMLEIWK